MRQFVIKKFLRRVCAEDNLIAAIDKLASLYLFDSPTSDLTLIKYDDKMHFARVFFQKQLREKKMLSNIEFF